MFQKAGRSYHNLLSSRKISMSRIAIPEKKKALCARLARIEGQLRGLQKLIETDADCEKLPSKWLHLAKLWTNPFLPWWVA
jgi:hypothetical protein